MQINKNDIDWIFQGEPQDQEVFNRPTKQLIDLLGDAQDSDVVQTTGDSTSDIMSQDQVTKEFEALGTSQKLNQTETSGTVLVKGHQGLGQPIQLGTTQLNSLTSEGLYYQNTNQNTSQQRNYPENLQGSLEVRTQAGVTQTYTVYNSSRVWVRGYYDGNWSAWNRLQIQGAVPEPMPVGTVIAFAGQNAPNGYLKCDGSAVSRTSYQALFQVIGAIYGNPGSTTFNIPDLRGMFIRGVGNSPEIDYGDYGKTIHRSAQLGVRQNDAIRNIEGNTGWGEKRDSGHWENYISGAFYTTGSNRPGNSKSDWDNSNIAFDASRVVPTAGENRPVNMAMTYCIKY